MKKKTQIFLTVLIVGKLMLVVFFLFGSGVTPLVPETEAVAAEPVYKVPEQGEAISPDEEEDLDLNVILKNREQLEEERRQLEKKRTELLLIEKDISGKIAELTRIREEIRADLDAKQTIADQKLKHLIKAYSAMKPQQAAALIEKLDTRLAIELLSKMKGEEVGRILAFADVGTAAKITAGLAKRD